MGLYPPLAQAVPFGEPWMVTPNLKALAESSTVFNRAYCNIAVCSPSRMSFLSGRYPVRSSGVQLSICRLFWTNLSFYLTLQHHTLTFNFINHIRQADCQEVGDILKPYNTLHNCMLY